METRTLASQPILVPLDGSSYADAAIPYAARLAGGARPVALIRVVPDVGPHQVLWQRIADSPRAASARYQAAALRWLEEKADSCTRAYDTTFDAAISVGEPAAAILRHADDRDATMIVMASAGIGAMAPLAFGSVADRVVRQATVPVMVIRPEEGLENGPEVRRLIVPLDGSRRAADSLPVAADLAQRLGVPVALVNVIDPTRSTPTTQAYEAAITGGFPGEVLAGLQEEAERIVDEAAAVLRAEDVRSARYVKYGNVAACVVEMCAPGDLIVMATHGRGNEGWPIGGVAGMLVRYAPVPLVLVRTAIPRGLDLMPVPVAALEFQVTS
jgi:nucleotide-binding universal stress UspA family protein